MPRSQKRSYPSPGPAFLALGTVLAVIFLGLRQQIPTNTPFDVFMPLRTSGKTALTLTFSRGTEPGIVEITLRSGTGVTFTLPPSWSLREVRGMEVRDIQSQAPTKAGRSWTMTAKGTASFWMRKNPRSFQLKNTTSSPLDIRIKQIFVREDRVSEESYLILEKPLQVW